MMGRLKKKGEEMRKASEAPSRTTSLDIDDEDPWGSKDGPSVSKEGPRSSKTFPGGGSSSQNLFIGGRRPSKERPSKQAQTIVAALGNVEDIIARVEQTRRSSAVAAGNRRQSTIALSSPVDDGTSPQRPPSRRSVVSREEMRRSPSKQRASLAQG